MSFAEDMGYDSYSLEDMRVRNDPGEWTTKDGDVMKVRDMTTSHLRNTLRYFEARKEEVDNYEEMEAEYKSRTN